MIFQLFLQGYAIILLALNAHDDVHDDDPDVHVHDDHCARDYNLYSYF